jgi:hypothetical protein
MISLLPLKLSSFHTKRLYLILENQALVLKEIKEYQLSIA